MGDKDKSPSTSKGPTPAGRPPGTTPDATNIAVTPDQFTALMSAINGAQSRLDSKLAEFKAEISESQEWAATSAAKSTSKARLLHLQEEEPRGVT